MSKIKIIGLVTVKLWTMELFSIKWPLTLTCDLDLGNKGTIMCSSSRYVYVPTMKFVCGLKEKVWPMLKSQNFIDKMTFDLDLETKVSKCAAPQDTCVHQIWSLCVHQLWSLYEFSEKLWLMLKLQNIINTRMIQGPHVSLARFYRSTKGRNASKNANYSHGTVL